MKSTTVEYQLDNQWQVVYQPENPDEDGAPYNIEFTISRKNGSDWEEEVRGQVKRSGCFDFGYGRRTMHHGCGFKDTGLLQLVYKECMAIMQEEIHDA